eukprot:11547278-Prorocentrum_lima.AAC.1
MSVRRCCEAGASEEPELLRTEHKDEKPTDLPTPDGDSLRQGSMLEDLDGEHVQSFARSGVTAALWGLR